MHGPQWVIFDTFWFVSKVAVLEKLLDFLENIRRNFWSLCVEAFTSLGIPHQWLIPSSNTRNRYVPRLPRCHQVATHIRYVGRKYQILSVQSLRKQLSPVWSPRRACVRCIELGLDKTGSPLRITSPLQWHIDVGLSWSNLGDWHQSLLLWDFGLSSSSHFCLFSVLLDRVEHSLSSALWENIHTTSMSDSCPVELARVMLTV